MLKRTLFWALGRVLGVLAPVLLVPSALGQVDLVVLPGISFPMDISQDGSRLAGEFQGGSHLWGLSEGFTQIVLPGGGGINAPRLSPNGIHLTGTHFNSSVDDGAMHYSEASGYSLIPLLPGQILSDGEAVTNDGTVFGTGAGGTPSFQAFRWSEALGTQPLEATSSSVRRIGGVSADGLRVVGSWEDPSTSQLFNPFVWEDATGYLTIPDTFGSSPNISLDGSTIVDSYIYALAGFCQLRRTNRFVNSGPAQAIDFLPGYDDSRVVSVGQDGSIVFGQSANPCTIDGFWVWTDTGGTVSVFDHLDANGGNPFSQWTDLFFTGMSDNGKAFCGVGTDPNGDSWVGFVVYVGGIPGCSEIGATVCAPAEANSTGMPAELAACGQESVVENSVRLTATSLPANQFGFFLNSMTPDLVMNPGGSQGNLCLGGQVGRYSSQIVQSGSSGEFSIDLDLAATPTPAGTVSISAGETWYFQAWFRDNNPTPTSNFTDSIRLLFQP